jgi:WXG100 family type VII secretion target
MAYPDGIDGLPPEMLQAANEADAIHDEVDAYITTLTAEVDAQPAHWRGTAPAAFNRQYGEFLTAGVQLKQWLKLLEEAARAGGGSYDAADFEAAGAMNSAAAGPPFGGGLTEA